MYFYVAAIPPGSGQFVIVARLYLWLARPDSSLESARSDSQFRRDWFAESRSLWPWSVAHLFIWNSSQFGQPLPQLAIDWEDSSADAHFFLESTPAYRRNTQIQGDKVQSRTYFRLYTILPNGDQRHIL